MSITEPRIVDRASQRYVGITEHVTMQNIGPTLGRVTGEVFGWLAEHGLAPAGAPFWKYNVIDMEHGMEVEVGFPVSAQVPGDERVHGGVLPGGRYATLTHTGHPSELVGATDALLTWARGQGLDWDITTVDGEQRWAARLEIYQTDPDEEPDMSKWVTVLAFRLAQ